MLESVNPTNDRSFIEKYAHQLEHLLAREKKKEAESLLKEIQDKHDEKDLDTVISVVCQVLDNVLTEKNHSFPRPLPPKAVVSHDEKDRMMSALLDMKVIWISDLENFDERIRCLGDLEKYQKVKGTKAYALYQAMRNVDKDSALTLISEYFSSIVDEKIKIELSSRMFEQLLIKWYDLTSKNINKDKINAQHEILQALLSQGAQTSCDLIKVFDKENKLANLVDGNTRKTKYVYRVG